MTYIGLFFFVAALLVATRRLAARYRSQALRTEGEWLALAQRGLHREFVFVDLDRLRRWTRYGAYAGIVLSLGTLSLIPGILGIASACFGPKILLHTVKSRRRKRFEKQFGAALSQIASILRVGHTFERALESLSRTEADPLGQELELVLKELRLGATMEEALQSLLERFPNRDLEILIRAVSISRRVGSNLAEAFSTVSDMVQTRSKLKDRLSSLTAQGRMQAWVAVLMPVGILFVLRSIDPDFLTPLFVTTTGRVILAICALMLASGAYWIRRIAHTELIR